MNNYLDLPATDTALSVVLELEPVGKPNVRISINTYIIDNQLTETLTVNYQVKLLEPFSIIIELYDKVYTTEYETAVIIKRLSVDNISVIPEYTHLAVYDNDHDFKDPTSYIGFNGKWALTFDRPFYQWLHQAQNQGWLLG